MARIDSLSRLDDFKHERKGFERTWFPLTIHLPRASIQLLSSRIILFVSFIWVAILRYNRDATPLPLSQGLSIQIASHPLFY